MSNSTTFCLSSGFDDDSKIIATINNIIDKSRKTLKVERGSIKQNGEKCEYLKVFRNNDFISKNDTIELKIDPNYDPEALAIDIIDYICSDHVCEND